MKFKVIDKKTGKKPDLTAILKEDWALGLYPNIDGFALFEPGDLVLCDSTGHYVCCPEGRFEVKNEGEN